MPSSSAPRRPVALIIRDGWGYNSDPGQNEFNAVLLAKKPVDDGLMKDYPHVLIKTCGLDVGLPAGVMGNSEVGHQNIGAGRIVDQEIVRIDKAILNETFFRLPAALKAIDHIKRTKGNLHVMGLISDAGVHATIDHIMACVELGKRNGLKEVYIHAFTDGRDTPPTSAMGYAKEVQDRCRILGIGKIATVSGRYYSMDRDKRWERVQKAYDCLVSGQGDRYPSIQACLEHYYANPTIPTMKGDEFVPPANIVDAAGSPVGLIRDGDAVIFANFRGDRPRELTRAFTDTDFGSFPREKKLQLCFVTMTEYEKGLAVDPLFYKPEKMNNILGMHISDLGLKQFRCAETEKYPHVTFFFNDYRDEAFPGEERCIVPSPKVPTYDLQPEMSAEGVCSESIKRIESGRFDLLVINFANPDMVGHTGALPAAIKAVEKVDECVGRILEAIKKVGGSAIVTADHGNCEQMYDVANKCPHTSHTLNDVYMILVDERHKSAKLKAGGRLADIAPTLLKVMGVPQPSEMSGQSLL
jgi:2,3-bisphosphoglycerate-independent phosphoglycerate mutase